MSASDNETPVMFLPFADKVQLSHEPPLETDGLVDGALLSAIAKAEVEAMERAFAAPPERAQSRTAEGRFVTSRSTIRGTLIDGTAIDYKTEVVLEIEGGVIVGVRARMDEANAAQHRKALQAGDFRRPAAGATAQ